MRDRLQRTDHSAWHSVNPQCQGSSYDDDYCRSIIELTLEGLRVGLHKSTSSEQHLSLYSGLSHLFNKTTLRRTVLPPFSQQGYQNGTAERENSPPQWLRVTLASLIRKHPSRRSWFNLSVVRQVCTLGDAQVHPSSGLRCPPWALGSMVGCRAGRGLTENRIRELERQEAGLKPKPRSCQMVPPKFKRAG